jgi:hypothetical protein
LKLRKRISLESVGWPKQARILEALKLTMPERLIDPDRIL